MLPTINGKDIIDCELCDLQTIINNPDYAENEYIDYKKQFAIDEVPKDCKQKEQIELRNDVCSFANANGGYLIWGIEEKKGIPTQIIGISIRDNNIDTFERNMKNYLQAIKPRIPYYRLKFIPLEEGNTVVIMFIQHDYFAPYIHLADQQDYKIFKRVGNSKSYMEYQELKNMFTQSLTLEKEIERFRHERINYYASGDYDTDFSLSKFFLMHIIPDTFLDSNYNQQMFVIERKGNDLSSVFYHFECNSRSTPIPEGLRFGGRGINAECRLYNNGIAEFFYPLMNKLHIGQKGDQDKGRLPYGWLWTNIENTIYAYVTRICPFFAFQRFFVVISIIGCKEVLTDENFFFDWYSIIDRNQLYFIPSVFVLHDNNKVNKKEMSRFHLDYLTSLGVKTDNIIDIIIDSLNNPEEI